MSHAITVGDTIFAVSLLLNLFGLFVAGIWIETQVAERRRLKRYNGNHRNPVYGLR